MLVPKIDEKYFEYPYKVSKNSFYWYIHKHVKILWFKVWITIDTIEVR